MIVLVAVILGAVALFGTGTARVVLSDLAVLETQEAAQRAAEAAASRSADLLTAGGTAAEVDAAAQSEASGVSAANLQRGTLGSASVQRSSSASDLVDLQVVLVVNYGGLVGPLQLRATGAASVPRSGP